MKKLKIVAAVLLAAITATAATLVEWSHSPAAENVTHYILEHRSESSSEWTQVEVSGTENKIIIPESAFGRWFRVAAKNSLGVGEFTEPARLPSKISGLKLVLEITP